MGREGDRAGVMRHLDLAAPIVAVHQVRPAVGGGEISDRAAQAEVCAETEDAIVEEAHAILGRSLGIRLRAGGQTGSNRGSQEGED